MMSESNLELEKSVFDINEETKKFSIYPRRHWNDPKTIDKMNTLFK